jgi:dTDP-glucose 4,6-dehydratase
MSVANNPLHDDLEYILERTAPLWDVLRGERLFLTGGTGFFGRWLLESFTWINHRLHLNAKACILSRDPQRFAQRAPHLAANAALCWQTGDVRSFPFPTGTYPFVLHAAAEASARLNQEAPRQMFDVILSGTHRVLEFSAQAQTSRFLFVSSGAIYGRQPPELSHLPETYPGAPDPLAPGSAYGGGKRAAEQLCALSGLPVTIVRPFAFVGPFLPLDQHFAVGNFLRDALHGGPIRIQGDGTPLRSYLYAADLTIGLWKALFIGIPGRAYNLGSAEALSIRQIAEEVATCFEPRPVIEVAKTAPPNQIPERYIPDITRAINELGLQPNIPLPLALRKTIEYLQKTGTSA